MKRMRKKSRQAAVSATVILAVGLILLCLDLKVLERQQYIEIEWEEVKDEEIQTTIKKAEPKEDIPINAAVQECEQKTIENKINEFTYTDSQLMMYLAQAEAGNQGTDGMWLVLSVILNRVNDSDWPDTIEEVINQKGAFGGVSDGRINEVELSPEVHEALARIESGDICPEIIGFEVKESNELDKYFKYAFTYRDHKFYTKK